LAAAAACSEFALNLPAAYGQHLHHLFLACDAAAEGWLDDAAEHLRVATAPGQPEMDQDYTFLSKLAQAVIEVGQSFGEVQASRFTHWRKTLAQLRGEHPSFAFEPERKRLYRVIMRRLALLRGGIVGTCWYVRFLFDT
jgi:hypothetical protein